jgi:hypothetical protein
VGLLVVASGVVEVIWRMRTSTSSFGLRASSFEYDRVEFEDQGGLVQCEMDPCKKAARAFL